MKISINDIPPEWLKLKVVGEKTFEHFRTITPYELTIEVLKKGENILLKGKIVCDIELQCSRCLSSFIQKIDSTLDIELRPLREINEEGYFELQKDDLDVGFYKGGVIDLEEIVSEQLFLNIPMKPLCSIECEGLCPQCGVDLNKNKCTCHLKGIDERLKILTKLIDKEE